MSLSVLAAFSLPLLACTDAPREMARSLVASTHAAPRDASASDAAEHAPARPRAALVEPDSWEILSADEDPFPDRLADPSCPEGSHMPELLAGEPVFSIDTGLCTYITARQPALRDVAKGETLVARVWHFALDASEAAEAHVALRIGDTTLLDQTVPIPSEGGLIAISEVATTEFEAGTPVFFHLHNHGNNSWALVELSAGPKP